MQSRRVWAEIDLDAISSNLRRVRELAPDRGVIAIVKANAYGHGAVPVGWHLAAQGVDALGVGDSHEAIELRRAGIGAPILILGAVVPGELADVVGFDIAVTVHTDERVRVLRREARRAGRVARVHLKIDTGMGRLGCTPARAEAIAQLVHDSEFLELEGLCTHFACAGPDGDEFTARQRTVFAEVAQRLAAKGIAVRMLHAAASGPLLRQVAPDLDAVRPGLALYGLAPEPRSQEGLTPALALKTRIIFLKDHPAGSSIGYERTHVTSRRTRIATLPVGYNDGYPWRLGGRGEVLVRGQRAPVVGRVSMDYLSIDVAGIAGASVGDEVVLIGSAGSEHIDARELAERAGTIPYEVFTRLGRRVERVYRGGAHGPEPGFGVIRRPISVQTSDNPR